MLSQVYILFNVPTKECLYYLLILTVIGNSLTAKFIVEIDNNAIVVIYCGY